MKKLLRFLLVGVVVFLGVSVLYFFVGRSSEGKEVVWGVSFSQKHAAALGLDWRAAYAALLDDLEVKKLKVSVDWDLIEPEQDEFRFENIDWQVAEAEKRKAKILLVMGMKTLRWPECHVPEWAQGLSKKQQQAEVLSLLETVVKRYKDSPAVWAWQIENEPLFPFGACPWRDKNFLKQEVNVVKSLDPIHPVVISDTGEFSLWIEAAKIGDIVSPTMYRKVWFQEISRYVEYPLPPTFYARKAKYIDVFFGKDVVGGELQAEPWGPGKLLYKTTIEEQDRAFDLAQFQKNITYAKRTGIKEHYLWGSEWWFWRKEKAQDPTFWREAKMLLSNGK